MKPGWNHEQNNCQPSWLMLVGRLEDLFPFFLQVDRDRVVVLARDVCISGSTAGAGAKEDHEVPKPHVPSQQQQQC